MQNKQQQQQRNLYNEAIDVDECLQVSWFCNAAEQAAERIESVAWGKGLLGENLQWWLLGLFVTRSGGGRVCCSQVLVIASLLSLSPLSGDGDTRRGEVRRGGRGKCSGNAHPATCLPPRRSTVED